MSKNLLLEIGTEEMPANMMSGIVEQMHALAGAKLNEARIAFEKVDVYATPRRLAVIVTAAADAQPDEEVKKRGPSIRAAYDENGNVTKAAEGFARGQGISAADLIKEGEYTWAQVVNKGKWWKKYCPLFSLLLSQGSISREACAGAMRKPALSALSAGS